ncbi:uncharacterized protein TRIREDRAFT_108604, partial [Trichoderma reesei QM6a]
MYACVPYSQQNPLGISKQQRPLIDETGWIDGTVTEWLTNYAEEAWRKFAPRLHRETRATQHPVFAINLAAQESRANIKLSPPPSPTSARSPPAARRFDSLKFVDLQNLRLSRIWQIWLPCRWGPQRIKL